MRSPILLPLSLATLMIVGGVLPSGVVDIDPLLTLWSVGIADAAAAESVTK
jgi:hypothetical protein